MPDTVRCPYCGQNLSLILTSVGKALPNHKKFVSYTRQVRCEGSTVPVSELPEMKEAK